MSDQNELSQKLSALLSNPEGLEQIKNMAAGLFSSGGMPFEMPTEQKNETKSEESPFGDIDMGKVLNVMGKLKSKSGENEKTRLLLALKPHLSEVRQKRVDSAVKILKLLELAPMLAELGIFNL